MEFIGVKNTIFFRRLKQLGIILTIPIITVLLNILSFWLIDSISSNNYTYIALMLILNLVIFLAVIRIGFKYFNGTTYLDRCMGMAFGLLCYLSLLFQFGVIFLIYYLMKPTVDYFPDAVAETIYAGIRNESIHPMYIIRTIYNYVFPNFYKYPTAGGIAVVVQFFLGKFTDIFILAFIVEKLKKPSA